MTARTKTKGNQRPWPFGGFAPLEKAGEELRKIVAGDVREEVRREVKKLEMVLEGGEVK